MATWTRGKRIVGVLTGVIGVASVTAAGAVSAVLFASTPATHMAASHAVQTGRPAAPTPTPTPTPAPSSADPAPAPAPATQAPAAPAPVPAAPAPAPAPAPVQPSQGGGSSATSSGS